MDAAEKRLTFLWIFYIISNCIIMEYNVDFALLWQKTSDSFSGYLIILY